jgi:hypothetical protein
MAYLCDEKFVGCCGLDWRNFTIAVSSWNRLPNCSLVNMLTFETIDRKVARRCRYHQHRDRKTTVTVDGSTLTGFVHSVMEVRFSNPTRWTVS